MKFLLSLLLIPWLTFSSPSGNQIGSFIMNEPNLKGFKYNSILICSATAEGFKRTGTIQCHNAISFPLPEGLK